MISRSAIALASFIFLSAAAPAPDPILNRVITEARANPPTSLAFERQTRTVSQEIGGENESQLRVDRWDGRIFTLVSINGKPPAAKEADAFRKAASARPVPGYYRIADLLKAGAVRLNDPQGRLVYRVTGLPKGTISVGKDVSANVMADFFVDASGAQPYVTRTRTVLIKPLSFFMVAKLDSLEIINDYKLDGNGKPYLAHATQAIAGAQFGKQGTTRIESNYSMLR